MSTCKQEIVSLPAKGEIFENEQHAANISKHLCRFYEQRMFVDVVLLSEGTKIEAHKNVLASISEYLSKIFQDNGANVKENSVEITEIPNSILKIIIDYMYSGWILLNLENIELVLRAAIFLKINNLIQGCCGFLQKNIENITSVRWLLLSKQLCLSELEDKCQKFIQKNLQEVTKTSEFLLLDKTKLKELLFNESRTEELEEQVFLGLMAWIEHDTSQRKVLLSDLLPMIRYKFLSAEVIFENRKSVGKSVENLELIIDWLQYHFSSDSKKSIEDKNVMHEQPPTTDEVNINTYTMCCVSRNKNSDVEIKTYDENIKTWSLKKRMPPLENHNNTYSTIKMDNKLIIVGGWTSKNMISRYVTCLNLRNFEITDLPPMQVDRCYPSLANLNGHLCVFGGVDHLAKFIDSVEIFNFSTKTWSFIKPPIVPHKDQRIVGHNGHLYILDNHYGSLQCYNTTSGKWTSKDQPIIDNVNYFSMTSDGNFVYCFTSEKVPLNIIVTIKRFDFSTNSWVILFKGKKNKEDVLLTDDLKIYVLDGRWILHDLKTNKIVVAPAGGTDFIFPYTF